MVEKESSLEYEIQLGFLEEPLNSIIVQPRFLPSKVGGKPAWIVPKSCEMYPPEKCNFCNEKLIFLLQILANLEGDQDHYRMLYMFICISKKCIFNQRAVQVYRCMIRQDCKEMNFATDQEYNDCNVLTEDVLIMKGMVKDNQEKYDYEEKKKVDEEDFQFEEFQIITEIEDEDTTKLYIDGSKMLSSQTKGNQGDDGDEDVIEEQYIANAYNTTESKTTRRILKKYEDLEVDDEDKEEEDGGNQVDFDDEGDDDQGVELSTNYSKISSHYKLFEIICSKNREQILRYAQPFYNSSSLVEYEPLWASNKGLINPEKKSQLVPKCINCGKAKHFEFQVMPQLFFYLQELSFVDWETICVYTCINKNCLPNFGSNQYFIPEFAFIQFSDDFSRVIQPPQNQQQKKKETQNDPKQKDEIQELKATKKAKEVEENNKIENQEIKEEIKREMENQMQDLLSNLNLDNNTLDQSKK